MFTCIVEDSTQPYNNEPTSKFSHSNSSNFENHSTYEDNVKELKRRIKRISNLLSETEAQRCTERTVYERSAKDMQISHEKIIMDLNTAHIIELTQVTLY